MSAEEEKRVLEKLAPLALAADATLEVLDCIVEHCLVKKGVQQQYLLDKRALRDAELGVGTHRK